MRTTEFDSSDEEEVSEEQLTPFHISWQVSTVLTLVYQQTVCVYLCQGDVMISHRLGGVLHAIRCAIVLFWLSGCLCL